MIPCDFSPFFFHDGKANASSKEHILLSTGVTLLKCDFFGDKKSDFFGNKKSDFFGDKKSDFFGCQKRHNFGPKK